MCNHSQVLDDYQRGDCVCVECGLVLEQILGHGGERERFYTRCDDDNVVSVSSSSSTPSLHMRERHKRLLFEPILALFHLDNDFVLEHVVDNYEKIYGGRQARRGFKKTEEKQKLAVAFSILNALSRLHMPRPVEDVMVMCGVLPQKNNRRKLLDIKKTLDLSGEEVAQLRPEDYELQDADPEDYLDVACIHLGIPFAVASEIHLLIAKAKWKLYGKKPTIINAAAILHTIRQRDNLQHVDEHEVCRLMNVTRSAVEKTICAIAAL